MDRKISNFLFSAQDFADLNPISLHCAVDFWMDYKHANGLAVIKYIPQASIKLCLVKLSHGTPFLLVKVEDGIVTGTQVVSSM
jgi:hypothetical protein